MNDSTIIVGLKKIALQILKDCTPPEVYMSGKYVMFISGLIASVSTGGNLLVIEDTLLAAHSIIQDVIALRKN